MIVNRQRRIRIPTRGLDRFTASAMKLLGLPAGSLTVCFVTEGVMARWNRTYRGKDRPTDVLSFPSGECRPQTINSGAEARRQKWLKNGVSRAISPSRRLVAAGTTRSASAEQFEDEMRILILHGILHLMGYDHETDTGQMERRERRLRRALGLA